MSVASERARNDEAVDGWLGLLKRTFKEFGSDSATLYAAALAFFSLFAIIPMLVIVIVAASFFWSGEAARQRMSESLNGMLGDQQLQALQTLLQNAQAPGASLFATLAGLVALVWAASRVFIYFEKALNKMWDIRVRRGTFKRRLKKRVTSFALVGAAAILMLAALIAMSVFTFAVDTVSDMIPWNPLVVTGLQVIATILVLTGVFMLVYKYVPDAQIRWSDVAVGSFATAVLFAAGQLAIGRFIGGSTVATAFGSFAAIAVVLLWLYYNALIVLLGAEFTQVYARFKGNPIEAEHDIAERAGRKQDGRTKRGRAA